MSSTRAKGEMPVRIPHSPHLEKPAERILRVSFLLGTHRSLSEQKSRRSYCWRGGERKRRKEQGRGQEDPLLAAAGTQEASAWRDPVASPSSLAHVHSSAGSRGTLGVSTLPWGICCSKAQYSIFFLTVFSCGIPLYLLVLNGGKITKSRIF